MLQAGRWLESNLALCHFWFTAAPLPVLQLPSTSDWQKYREVNREYDGQSED